ncbi:hypothetical protein L313_2669 [Acinetobacter haemolyticus CIP 64.3 = MTCC 9819]|nr:hypothetical protein L313_2669 [Acinetobacter haemolyticus CIP 64.3 = MTCC 9819]
MDNCLCLYEALSACLGKKKVSLTESLSKYWVINQQDTIMMILKI